MAQPDPMPEPGDELADALLGPLHMHFLAARTVYGHYLERGRTFAFAVALRQINRGARDLLLAKGHLLPEPLQQDAADLIAHYDVWLALWEDHRERTRPDRDDPFVFENSFTYPREAEARLEELYRSLTSGRLSAG